MPSVTQILRDTGCIDVSGPWFTDETRDRGTAVHKAIELLIEGDLDWFSLDDRVRPRVEQFNDFMQQTDFVAEATEMRVTGHGFIGHLDILCRINGVLGVMDVKPNPSWWHPLQLAGYASTFPTPLKRWNLYCNDTSYKLVEHSDPDDYNAWAALVTVWHYMETHKK